MCARSSFIQFKVVHQAHMSKVKIESTQELALNVLGVNVQMPHLDKPQSGALLAICGLFETVSAVFERRLEPDPLVMLFEVTYKSCDVIFTFIYTLILIYILLNLFLPTFIFETTNYYNLDVVLLDPHSFLP